MEKSENFSPTCQGLQDASHVMELKVLWQETKVWNLRTGPPDLPVQVGLSIVKSADGFIYLGCKQSSKGCSKLDILQSIGLTNSSMKPKSHLWVQKHLYAETKFRIYQTCHLDGRKHPTTPWSQTLHQCAKGCILRSYLALPARLPQRFVDLQD